MEEDIEYNKLPVEDRVVHKLWKARVHGYEECAKSFRCIDDQKSPEFNKFLGLVKKFVIDSNAAAQEKGLEAVLAFVENAAVAGKTVSDVMGGIVSKCIAAPKTKTKELAVQVTLMYIEIEKQEAVQEELLKGTEAKNPKIVSACVSTLTLSLREFGPKVVNVKPLIKKLPAFLEDRDKSVRDEGKILAVEIYKWIGAPLKQQLNTLKPVQLTELETEFQNVGDKKNIPNRYLKSQKPKETRNIDTDGANDEDDEKEVDEGDFEQNIDPYELFTPVDILSKLPKDFFDKVESKKWQDRKEGLESLQKLAENPKLESGDYGDVVRVLKKLIAKDSNVLIVALAGKCLTGLANGLKKQFSSYALPCLPTVLEKFREKKQNVVQVLRECSDALFLSITIEVISEDVIAGLENKNPAVKAETAAFLARSFTKTPSASLNKKLLKAYSTILLKTLNESDPLVRDNSAEALGTLMKLIGEKAFLPFLPDLDNLKMAKIKECAEKAVIIVKNQPVKKAQRPQTAKAQSPVKNKDTEMAKPKRPAAKKTGIKKSDSSGNTAAAKKTQSKPQAERNLTPEEVDEIASQILSNDVISGLVDSNWKTRLAAVEQLAEIVKAGDPELSAQVIVRTLTKKPGFKDTNFQVLKLRIEIVKLLAENYPFSTTVNEYCLMDITEKLGDVKNSSIAAETLTAIAEATSFDQVANEVITFAFNQKNPKVQQESLVWLSKALTDFGCPNNTNALLDNVKKAVAAVNPTVRSAGINLVGNLYLYMGRNILNYFDGEKPALKLQIEQECEKRSGDSAPNPIRGAKSKKSKVQETEEIEEKLDEKSNENQEVDHHTRTDISCHITESLFSELSDKNWKVRNEGLQKITNILNETKFIKSSIGDLPQMLAPRLVDSNSKIAQTCLGVCGQLATAMGSPIKQHIRTLFPGFIQCLGDSKTWIRTAAVTCINTWTEQCGYKDFFDGEIIGDALKAGSPVLRSELWTWLSTALPVIPVKQIPKEELTICLPILYSNLEDRNSDVRKNAQEAVLGFMIHLSFEAMSRFTEKLKPGSKTVVLTILDKSRSNLPVKPLPSKKTYDESAQKTVKSGGAMKASKVAVKTKGGAASKPGTARKKEEEVDSSPLLAVNNLKHQRVIDEQKLKVLKWNFTTPREEFVDLLKELMATANVNKSLASNMFHADFRYHLKAIEALTEDLPGNNKALVSNLDLILKWLTLRFFDTNPSVLLKGLEYLQAVFNILIDDQYHMQEHEAASFIPYLIIKIGDPKDTVRNGVRALFKQIALVYPVSKLFMYTMEGLKSKNARQRTECLDQLGSLIENYGISVCQPTPSVALKEVAKQIADRDNSVRNAALNCIVQAYFLEGEKVYKFIGHISEKDQSLLDERIKRAAKNRPLKSSSSTQIAPPRERDPVPAIPVVELIEDDYEDEIEEEQENEAPNERMFVRNIPQQIPTKPSGPFGLDMELLERIESTAPVKCRNPILLEPNLDDLNDTIHIKLQPNQIIPISPPKLLEPKSANIQNLVRPKGDELDRKIEAMTSLDPSIAIQAMNNMETFLKSHQFMAIQTKEDKFMSAVNLQLKLLQTYSLNTDRSSDISKAFRTCFMVILAFYESGFLGKNVPTNHLKELVHQMITLLAENKLDQLNEAEAYNRVINNVVIKTIDNSNHTTIICVLVKLLHDCTESDALPKYEELVMKCLWKIVKTIPNWASELDYDAILLEVHNFFKDYPSTWWKKRKSDTPLRTIKTILHSMTRIKGNSILNHLSQINNTNESELHSYLLKLITTLKPDEMNAASRNNVKPGNQVKSQKHLCKYTHQQLSEIFKKIGSKTQTQEGLTQLYDFKLQHPEADVQPFLVKSHQFFQDFIEQGLKNIDQARKSQNHVSQINKQYIAEAAHVANVIPDSRSLIDPLDRLQKLRNLEAQCRKDLSKPSD
ncbi:protein mini spindles [Leptopilina heterotoma]|uniref:protein mini spindles n=1 Tax=Leptopilina heterotoma TaxID=63436 RepID=UPI001CA83DB9|nr:protein mini spindles [Leptopilina heterotoma]